VPYKFFPCFFNKKKIYKALISRLLGLVFIPGVSLQLHQFSTSTTPLEANHYSYILY
jgi:hypothetical protein